MDFRSKETLKLDVRWQNVINGDIRWLQWVKWNSFYIGANSLSWHSKPFQFSPPLSKNWPWLPSPVQTLSSWLHTEHFHKNALPVPETQHTWDRSQYLLKAFSPPPNWGIINIHSWNPETYWYKMYWWRAVLSLCPLYFQWLSILLFSLPLT